MKDCRHRALFDPPPLPEVSLKQGSPLRLEQVPYAEVQVQTQAQVWAGAGEHSVCRRT